MKRMVVTKALLLALAVGVACADLDPAQISGPWRTIAMAADNMDMIQEGGPHQMLLRRIECDTGCNALNVFYYDRRNSVCTPHMVVAQKNEDGVYLTESEGQERLQLLGWADNTIVVIDHDRLLDGTPKRLMFIALKPEVLNDWWRHDFARFMEEHGIPRENILHMDDMDTCPP